MKKVVFTQPAPAVLCISTHLTTDGDELYSYNDLTVGLEEAGTYWWDDED